MTAPNTAPVVQGDTTTRLPFNAEDFLKDIDQRVARLITKNKGDPEEAIALVMMENKKYRDQLAAMEGQLKSYTERLPKDAVVLTTAEDRALFKAAQDLKLAKPEDLPALVKERDELLVKQKDRDEESLYADLAGDEYDDVGLREILGLKGVTGVQKEITVRDPKDPKKTVKEKIPHIKDKAGVEQPLKEWLDANVSKTLLAALRKDASAKDSGSTASDGGRRRPASFPDQSSVATPSKGKAGALGSNQEAVGNYLSNTFTLPDHLKKKE